MFKHAAPRAMAFGAVARADTLEESAVMPMMAKMEIATLNVRFAR